LELTEDTQGEADLLGSTVRLGLTGSRGLAVTILWRAAIEKQKKHEWNEVDLLVSLVGFMHKDDFQFKPFTRKAFSAVTRLFGTAPAAWLIRYVGLNGPVIRTIYTRLPAGSRRLSAMDPVEAKLMLEFDVHLWQINDVKTHWRTTSEFLQIDNCKKRIALPVWHVASKKDHYFNNHIIEQHMLVVFESCRLVQFDARGHTPDVLSDKKGLGVMLPPALRKVLAKPVR